MRVRKFPGPTWRVRQVILKTPRLALQGPGQHCAKISAFIPYKYGSHMYLNVHSELKAL